MNGFEPAAVPTEAEIDRLVEGESSAAERRTLFARIESSPDGWKRCAIAFLEAQAWREAVKEEPRTIAVAPTIPSRSWRATSQRLAIALCVAAAFLGGRWSLGDRPRNAVLVQHEAAQPAMQQFVADAGVRTLGQVVWPSQGTIAVRGVPSMLITVYEGSGIDDRWCAALPSVLPDLVAKQLERQGCKVREERRLLPLALADGRRLALRVDQLHFTLTGKPSVL